MDGGTDQLYGSTGQNIKFSLRISHRVGELIASERERMLLCLDARNGWKTENGFTSKAVCGLIASFFRSEIIPLGFN